MTITADRPIVDATSSKSPPNEGEETMLSENHGWRSQHLGTAIIGAILGYVFGHWLGNYIASGYTYIANSGMNAVANTLALAFGTVGWLAGIGALNYPIAKMAGKEPKKQKTVDYWSKYVRDPKSVV